MKENKYLEFKQDYSNSFLKTVSAFCNYEGGEIHFGVCDDGTIIGIENISEFCLKIENKINELIKPNPIYTIDNNGKVVILKVKEGLHKPYFYNSKVYKRNDTSTIEVDNLELKRLILEGENKNFEQTKSKKIELTFNYLSNQIKTIKNINNFNQEILKTLDLYDDNNGYNIAGELLSDQNTLPYIDIAKFGESINIIKKRIDFSGKCILEQYNLAVELFKDNYLYEVIEDIQRKVIETIPLNAFREALANAIVHRTWDDASNIQISFFDDKVEIVSSGGLINGMTEDKYLNGMLSCLRNPILGNVFYRLNYIEKFGTGIKRIITSYEFSKLQPQFIIKDNLVKVILPLYTKKLNMNSNEEIVYNFLSRNQCSSSEIAKALNFSKTKTVSILNSLVEKEFIKTAGESRWKKYFKL